MLSRVRTARLTSLLLLTLTGFSVAIDAGAAEAQGKSTEVRLALRRAVPRKWDLEASFKNFLGGVNLAAQRRADIFITPECWLDGYASPDQKSTPEKIRSIAQDLEASPYLKQVAAKAKEPRLPYLVHDSNAGFET